MSKLNTKGIRDLAKDIISKSPEGIRYAALVKKIKDSHDDTPINTIHGTVWDLHVQCPTEISKPSKGLFVWIGSDGSNKVLDTKAIKIIPEENFYEPIAEYLRGELDEATEAEKLGGSILKAKWGTPDVIGVYKPRKSDLVKFPPEIVSVEVKTDITQPIVAFGQAISYRLFSTRVYIAMPESLSGDDRERLEALCLLFGIGLIFFKLDKDNPDFELRVRAQKHNPDMYYVNQFAQALNKADASMFERLF